MVTETILIPTQTRRNVNLSIWTVFVGRSLSMRICGGLATGRASRGRFFWLARARQFWQEQESCSNPEESGGIWWKCRNSCPAGIPAKNSYKSGWNRNSQRPLQNHVPVNKFLQKKRNPQESCFVLFFSPKNKFLSNRNYQPSFVAGTCSVTWWNQCYSDVFVLGFPFKLLAVTLLQTVLLFLFIFVKVVIIRQLNSYDCS